MTEKRFFVRIPSHMECRCYFDDERVKGFITDFSSDGMRIHIDSDEEYELEVGDSIGVKYATNLELDSATSPIIIKCHVIIRNMMVSSDDEYAYRYQLGCQLENTTERWD